MDANERAVALGRFDHHPDPAIDFCIEVEEIQSIIENARLGLSGMGHEEDRADLNNRIERALDFRVGGDEQAVNAKAVLRRVAAERGFVVDGVQSYAGQPLARGERA
jgi:hypothetical protein